jgi:hypothetical protein
MPVTPQTQWWRAFEGGVTSGTSKTTSFIHVRNTCGHGGMYQLHFLYSLSYKNAGATSDTDAQTHATTGFEGVTSGAFLLVTAGATGDILGLQEPSS